MLYLDINRIETVIVVFITNVFPHFRIVILLNFSYLLLRVTAYANGQLIHLVYPTEQFQNLVRITYQSYSMKISRIYRQPRLRFTRTHISISLNTSLTNLMVEKTLPNLKHGHAILVMFQV